MVRFLERAFRFLCAAQAGAQLFFIAAATQVIFPPQVALLPHENSRRTLAADLVGQLLVRLDSASLVVSGAAVLLSLWLWRLGESSSRRALQPLLAGLCALASMLGTTPAIQLLRAANRTGDPLFGKLHGLSSGLLLCELLLFAWAALAPSGAPTGRPSLDAAATSR